MWVYVGLLRAPLGPRGNAPCSGITRYGGSSLEVIFHLKTVFENALELF